MSTFDLLDKVIIITGAAGGIGTEISRECARAGAKLVLVGRTQKTLDALADDLTDTKTLVVPTDVTDPAGVQNLVARAVEKFSRIDVCLLYTSDAADE